MSRRDARYEVREVEGGWAIVPTWQAVDSSQAPPPDMLPLELIVLDSLADGDETVYTMRDCGEMAPNGLALVGERHFLPVLRDLLARGLITVTGELRRQPSGGLKEERVPDPATDDASLRRYWFALTAAGEAARVEAVTSSTPTTHATTTDDAPAAASDEKRKRRPSRS